MSGYKWENLKVLADDDKTIDARKIAFNLLLDILVKNDFHPTGVDCDDEDINNYYSFYIKELPGWLFNVWFGEYKEPGYLSGLLFTQYEEAAFKITPTSAKMKTILEFGTFKNNIDTLFPKEKGEMLNVLNFILKEPYLAFYRDVTGTNFNYEYVSRRKAKKLFHSWCKEQREKEKLKRLI